MRLVSLEVAGFRGLATRQTFDLDADAVVVVGANGNGKTSLFDAILWALCGRIPRLGTDDAQVLSRFSDAGQATVVLRLRPKAAEPTVTVTRTFDGKDMRIALDAPEGSLRGPEAEGRLIRMLWREASTAASPADAIATALTRSLYLQQDLLRDFVDAATEQERFSAVSELVGAGRIAELQIELERAKKSWTAATNSRASELQPYRSRLSTMESRLTELTRRAPSVAGALDEADWAQWWEDVRRLGVTAAIVERESRGAAIAVDAALKQIAAARHAEMRKLESLEVLTLDIRALASAQEPDLGPLRDAVADRRRELEAVRIKVREEQERLAENRRREAELDDQSQQVRALAKLALKQLGHTCPVCEQQYDVSATRTRLEALAHSDVKRHPREGLEGRGGAESDLLSGLLSALAASELAASSAELALIGGERAASQLQAARKGVRERLAAVTPTPNEFVDSIIAVREASASLRQRVAKLERLQQTGESLALRLALIGDAAIMRELHKEIGVSRAKLQRDEGELAARTVTGDRAQKIIEALRDAALRLVTERVKEIEPVLSDMYSRIDVHPAFRIVRFLASVVRGRGQLATVVSDPLFGIESDEPGSVLSSSQLNALAVCLFLSLNLGIAQPPLDAAILDDPLQSLDDINLLGLVDLLRQTKDRRQLCVSTHDARFGSLLARKLRPRSSQQRTLVIELDTWSRQGPQVRTYEIESDPVPLRLLASA